MLFTQCEPKKWKIRVSSRLHSLFRPASCFSFTCKGKFHTPWILTSCFSFWSLMLLELIPDICLFMQGFVGLCIHTRMFWLEVSSAKHWIWVISFIKYANMQKCDKSQVCSYYTFGWRSMLLWELSIGSWLVFGCFVFSPYPEKEATVNRKWESPLRICDMTQKLSRVYWFSKQIYLT